MTATSDIYAMLSSIPGTSATTYPNCKGLLVILPEHSPAWLRGRLTQEGKAVQYTRDENTYLEMP